MARAEVGLWFARKKGDPLRNNRLNFMQRSVPSWLLYFIVILAAFIFQTGRVNLKAQGSGARPKTWPGGAEGLRLGLRGPEQRSFRARGTWLTGSSIRPRAICQPYAS